MSLLDSQVVPLILMEFIGRGKPITGLELNLPTRRGSQQVIELRPWAVVLARDRADMDLGSTI